MGVLGSDAGLVRPPEDESGTVPAGVLLART